MRTYSTLKELEENSQELPEGIANHPMLTPMSKLVKESPVNDKKVHDAGHRDEKLLKKHDEEGGKSSVEKDAYPQDTSVPPEAKDLKNVKVSKKTIRADERTMDQKEAQEKATVNYEQIANPELVEAKDADGYYVKYATAKKGPISQVYFTTKDQAEGFLQRINKMGARGIISDKPTKGAIPMGHSQVRRQQEVEVVEENADMEEGAWDSVDWRAISDLARSNPKKFRKKTDWVDWLNTNVAKDNPAAAKKAVQAWESMELPEILDFIEEQCKCQELSVKVDGRTKEFKETRKRIESRLARLKERLTAQAKESFKK